jgi:hypothetical protein
MRQPSYGTSYITGKYLLDEAMTEYARKMELSAQPFTIRNFMDRMNQIGSVPTSLAAWELTGENGMIKESNKRQ